MDFYKVIQHTNRMTGEITIAPDYVVTRSKDLMTRGRKFYAIWDEEKNLWSTDEYDVQKIVDKDLWKKRKEVMDTTSKHVNVASLASFSSNAWKEFRKYVFNISDNATQLDTSLTFANTEVNKASFVSKRLEYNLEEGDISAYDEMIGTLYDKDERAKLEWSIGAIVAGDSKFIQKFLVLYGKPGSGKGTFLDICSMLFKGYIQPFEAKELGSASSAFATGAFKDNPIVAIQYDGDLSRIEDNTTLNSIISHEEILINVKGVPQYPMEIISFCMLGTNTPVKITNSQSGIIRRLIDVYPSGRQIDAHRYDYLMSQIKFELGAIAYHCLKRYKKMGPKYYKDYRPVNMMYKTDYFFNFVSEYALEFSSEEYITAKTAWTWYKTYCDESKLKHSLQHPDFREELKNYFDEFTSVKRIDGKQVRNVYEGFKMEKISGAKVEEKETKKPYSISLTHTKSVLDELCADCLAQEATSQDTPYSKWANVKTKLGDLDTTKTHFLKLEAENHIVLDFDIKDEQGNKSMKLNLEAAKEFPPTYTEVSKGGNGLHLHYIYDGDVDQLSRLYSEDIEVKVFKGDSSLRRRLSKCNNLPIAHISSGLPLKGEKVINFTTLQNETAIRTVIEKNLRKEYHSGTKPSIDFIYKTLNDAYEQGIEYDVTELRPRVMAFATNSSHQAPYCVKLVSMMKWKSDTVIETHNTADDRLAFYDIEVYPNLFLICWKYENSDEVQALINPTPAQVTEIVNLNLVGFNCRRYDNHVIYGAMQDANNQRVYELSKRLIGNSKSATFQYAYNLSYLDVYEMATTKQSLKKWMVELGINHIEMDIDWDQPVKEEDIPRIVEYCKNDVRATEAVFHACQADYSARLIISKLSGLPVNSTTQNHAAQFIFDGNKNPQSEFVYTDLSEMFPGYTFDHGKSMYKGVEPGEGGYVNAKPGMYGYVGLFDITSQHPTSLIKLNLFGDRYTARFEGLVNARVAVKNGDVDALKTILNGVLYDFLEEHKDVVLKDLSYALKIVINIVYGMCSAGYENIFKDPRNKDNIVAKRGALFMIDLNEYLNAMGINVIHTKTDSIKVSDITPDIYNIVQEFAKKYGYNFEHEATYDKFCLVNKAVYVAKDAEDGHWTATGAQFKEPYVFKKLFSKEPIELSDMYQTKEVKSAAIYIDRDGDKQFIGKVGNFLATKKESGGGLLVRRSDTDTEGKYNAVVGTKGFYWMEQTQFDALYSSNYTEHLDYSYYNGKVDEAVSDISAFGDFEWFVSETPYSLVNNGILNY